MNTKAMMSAACLALLALNSPALGQSQTPPPPSKAARPTAEEILAKGIVTVDDFRRYLITSGKWTWEIGKHHDQTIKFNPDGTALHTELVMKYSIDSVGVVKVRHPNGKSARITFSKDFKSYEGAWDKNVPLVGKPVQ